MGHRYVDLESISDEELANLTIKELNDLLRNKPKDIASKIKMRRRLLKNRGYAQNTRVKRVETQDHLETERAKLSHEIQQLKRNNSALRDYLQDLRAKRQKLTENLRLKKSGLEVKR